jgi:hypothetical protein
MKKVLPFLFAIVAMGIAMFVVASVMHIDIKAEIGKLRSSEGVDDEFLPEIPEA